VTAQEFLKRRRTRALSNLAQHSANRLVDQIVPVVEQNCGEADRVAAIALFDVTEGGQHRYAPRPQPL
jgi:hypothetical protein